MCAPACIRRFLLVALLLTALTSVIVNAYKSFHDDDPPLEDQVCRSVECEGLKSKGACWGYEDGCRLEKRYGHPICDGKLDESSERRSIEEPKDLFWRHADFGYVKNLIDSMVNICTPVAKGDSLLKCVERDQYCSASNLYMDLRQVNFQGSRSSFSSDILGPGKIGGHCKLNKRLHEQQEDKRGLLRGGLHSWYGEIGNYTSLNFKVVEGENCDEFITDPTWIVKLDAGSNIYHHFCDFFNLYVSQHINGSFSTEARILMWDTSELEYYDYCPEVWAAFSRFPMRRLHEFLGKRVCFREAIFALLPRTVGGLYYNSWIPEPSCHSSTLFKAFSEHIIGSLHIVQHVHTRMKVTYLSRQSQYRNVKNEVEIIEELRKQSSLDVQYVQFAYEEISFRAQMQVIRDTDIFIGMHGAGLTHMLFLPDWAAVFELYNTEDANCYKDLARLRGVGYFTWVDKSKIHPTNPHVDNPKMTDYYVEIGEFMRLFDQCVQYVLMKKGQL